METDPQRLWVGPTSRAAEEKEAYERSFGPFYRVEQLIVTTTPHSLSPFRWEKLFAFESRMITNARYDLIMLLCYYVCYYVIMCG